MAADNTDSMIHVLKLKYAEAAEDKEKAVILRDLCWYYRYISLDSTILYGKESIKYCQKTGQRKIEGEVNRFIGISNWHYALEDESLEWIYKSLNISEAIDDKEGQAYCYDNIGNSYYSQGDYTKAFENFKKAKEIFLAIKNLKGYAYTLLHSSRVLAAERKFTEALQYAEEAIDIRRKFKDDTIAVYNAQKELASVYRHMGDYEKAIEIYKSSLKPLLKTTLYFNISDHYQQLAESYRLDHQLDSAIKFGLLSMNLAKPYNNYRQIMKTAKTLQLAYAAQKRYEEALTYQDIFAENKERLNNDKVILKLARKNAEHEFNLKTEHINSRNLLIIITLLSLLIVASIITFIIYSNQKKTFKYNIVLQQKNTEIIAQKEALEKQKAELTRLNDVKDKMFSVVSHDIRAPLTSLQSMLYLYNSDLVSVDEIGQLMPAITNHVSNTATFVDNLLYWAKGQFTGINVKKIHFDFIGLAKAELALLNKKAEEKDIQIHLDPIEHLDIYADKDMLGIVIRNLLTNAIKFTEPNKHIFIRINEQQYNTIFCIEDQGRGMSEEQVKNIFTASHTTASTGTAQEKGVGLGLILCKDFIEKNEGMIWVESKLHVGSKFFFSIPKTTH